MYEQAQAVSLYCRKEYEKAAALFLEGAREGDALAAYHYGYCLLHGIGVLQSASEAKSYFSYARYLEGGEACYQLAMLYLHGIGVPRDYRQAIDYMRESAERGCVEAQLYMGVLYTTGCVFSPDIVGISMLPFHTPEYRAEKLLSSSDPADDPLLDEDRRFSVVSADAREAFEWFRMAARGDPTYVQDLVAKGQYLYAKCFIDGLGTEIDRARGARLMLAAGKSGSSEAVQFLEENGIDPVRLLSGRKKKNAEE